MRAVPILLVLVAILLLYFSSKEGKCYTNSDCSWQITNCCPESAGAKWECVNLRTFKKPVCPKDIACIQVVSPKPKMACICEEGECVVK